MANIKVAVRIRPISERVYLDAYGGSEHTRCVKHLEPHLWRHNDYLFLGASWSDLESGPKYLNIMEWCGIEGAMGTERLRTMHLSKIPHECGGRSIMNNWYIHVKVKMMAREVDDGEFQVTGSEIVVHADMQEISLTNLKVSSSKTIDSRERTKRYRFDYCFDSSDPTAENYANQTKIYETLGQSVIDALYTGYNACLVAYGQSASGKTYTMMGTNDDPGLIPRICDGIFSRAVDEKKSGKMSRISVSYLEVYNERVRDLLVPAANLSRLRVREHPRLGPYVHGLIQHPVDTLDSLMSRIEEGSKTRKTASTLQNLASSRSHAILTLSVDPGNGNSTGQAIYCGPGISKKTDFPRGCKLHLVDLAGSENSAASIGINRLKEGANINKSLVALGNVISALAERSATVHASTRRFIPYRDSTLTWLLKDSLGGNAATIMLATISPASGSYNETSHTLRFAQRAQSVINKPIINEDPVAKIIRELRDEVEKLKALLLEKDNEAPNGCKSLCICQQSEKQTYEKHNSETRCVSTSTSNSPTVEHFVLSEVPGKWNKYIDNARPIANLQSTDPSEQFGLLEFSLGFNDAEKSLISTNYHRAAVSELIEDRVDEPVFVDIPTLVAVLIKPDNSAGGDTHHIEEISSNNALEDNIYTDFNGSSTVRVNSLVNNFGTTNPSQECCPLGLSLTENHVEQTSSFESNHPTFQTIEAIKNSTQGRSYLSDQCSLNGSNETLSLPAVNKCQTSCLSGSSLRLVDNQAAVDLDKSNEFDGIARVEDRPNCKTHNKGHPKAKGRRKQCIGSIKRKTSKDSSSSNSKDEEIFISGIPEDKLHRKSSLDSEQFPSRPHTVIQRARRADIVAAVTERLYSRKKISEDTTTASTPASDIRSRENSDVTLATSTRMRLQEISRKMLAKRRRICVDTQTESITTTRVKDASVLVREPKIIRKDASMLTDRHEDYDTLLPNTVPVLRVKEVATSTSDSPPPQQLILLKDACNITETYDHDDQTMDSYQQDSGIISDIFMSDTQTYANSNLSDAGTSDLFSHTDKQSAEMPIMIASSSNTEIIDGPVNISAQTNKKDINDGSIEKCHKSKWIRPHSMVQSDLNGKICDCSTSPPQNICHRPFMHNSHCCANTNCESRRSRDDQTDRSIISIALPDMINITIESPNVLDSKIQVFDSTDHNENHVHIQTEKKELLEASTLTDDDFRELRTDYSEIMKLNGNQGDIKTFRIENIFQNPHEDLPRFSKTNETSFREISNEESSYYNFRRSLRLPGLHKNLVTRDWVGTNATRHNRRNIQQNNTDHALSSTSMLSEETNKQPDDVDEVISWRDFQRENLNSDGSISRKLDELKFDSENVDDCYPTAKIPIDRITNDPSVCEQEKIFSDDSLDSRDVKIKRTVEPIDTSESIVDDTNDLNCPPDVVAHTKKDTIDPLILSEDTFISDDFNDTYVELPKTKLGVVSSESLTPAQEFKSLIIGVPLISMAVCQEESRKNTTATLKHKKRVSFGETNIIGTITPTLIDHAHSDTSHEFVNNHPIRSEKNTYAHSLIHRSDTQYTTTRKINSKDSKDSLDANSDLENDTSTRANASSYEKRKSILEEYMEEAVVYMRNINSSNQLTNIRSEGLNERKSSINDRQWNSRLKDKDHDGNIRDVDMGIGPYDKCLKSMDRLEKYLSRVKRQDVVLPKKYYTKANASAETKLHLAKISPDSVNSCWSCSRFRNYLSLDDLNRKHDIESDNFSQRNSHSSQNGLSLTRRYNENMNGILPRKVHRSHSQIQNNSSKFKKSSPLHNFTTVQDHGSSEDDRCIDGIIDSLDTYPKLTEEALIAKVQKSLPLPRCAISKYDSANENSSSNDEFDTYVGAIDEITRPKDKLKYSTSPRVKFQQLLSERRKIIEKSRTTSAS